MPVTNPSAVTTAKKHPTLEKISTIIANQMGVDKVKLQGTTSLADLGCDELDYVELIMEFEDKFDISISDERAEELLGAKDWNLGMKNVTLAKLANMVDAELSRR